jgi:A/G-specific adenine glycosylase
MDGDDAARLQAGTPLRHVFTHFDLLIHPMWCRVAGAMAVADEPAEMWYDATRPASVGLPAPISALLDNPPP